MDLGNTMLIWISKVKEDSWITYCKQTMLLCRKLNSSTSYMLLCLFSYNLMTVVFNKMLFLFYSLIKIFPEILSMYKNRLVYRRLFTVDYA